MSSFNFKIWNRHILIDSNNSNMLIDTGSPKSFQQDGIVKIGDDEYTVSKSLMGIDASYLSRKVGCKISGLLGMDIMNSYSIWFNSPKFGNFILFSDKDDFKEFALPVSSQESFMGCPTIYLNIKQTRVKFLFDSGAPVSYISSKFLKDIEVCGKTYDFSPLLQSDKYEVDLYYIPYELGNECFNALFARMPSQLEIILTAYHVDGIIGFDLIDNFRLCMVNGTLFLPPQGI